MLAQQLDFLDGLVKISNQGLGQLHLVGKASNAVMISHRQHHNFSSCTGSAREVAVLRKLHLIILLMSQDGQSFSCSILHTSLEWPPQYESLDYLVDKEDMMLAVIKCIYLLPTYLHFIQDIEDRCLLLMSSRSIVDQPFQEHRTTERHHMD
jgi:hypothetical protein